MYLWQGFYTFDINRVWIFDSIVVVLDIYLVKKKKDDSKVATAMNYDVASFLKRFKSM